ncbi:ferrous iron transport protein B [Desulfotalea psychrophila]|uniref:Ferrous iron transport protein B n=1 Tax=Desulfotalea psychrophila (strain LSv54 / DSM 12343) TaxID=177439 RepID=Q6AS03_DESPS|nr:ferrous iron transport protein B [Desulfotalea psychrophila]CAG34872.1 related to ferrous iron transport protein B [Desulfotalea psychrophila LSv54]
MHKIGRIAIAGVPNCGKTTLFNSLTGAKQTVGNWPGVTVEKVEGSFSLRGSKVELVDLPGTYNLSPDTEDQKVAERVIREGEYDLILNVVDASNLSRNLYLTMDLKERTSQIIILLNMLDVAKSEGIDIDVNKLSEELGVPVIPVIAVCPKSVQKAVKRVEIAAAKLPKHDSHASRAEVMDTVKKYAHIDKIYNLIAKEKKDKKDSITNRIDNIVMNRFAAIPIFLLSMFVTFWFAIGVGSVFIDFFDIMGGLLFIEVPTAMLNTVHAPEWLIVMIAGGLGTGCQTVATFIPVVFFMFLALAILENLGYMSRVGVVADRFMRKIGLPGSAFIPMIVGFGCTVPAIMAARTLTTTRDRYMTIFMAPFMSCGARLPVYALFCSALFGAYSGLAVFMIYITGLFMAILTGFFLKNTLFKGASSHFVMDLPLYHKPQVGAVLLSAWLRLKNFIGKAGVIVVLAVFCLSLVNSVGIEDGKMTFGNEDSQSSILAHAGKAITPIFEPMGIQRDNWPASVALFTGLFAKEAIVGTINSLYASVDMTDLAEATTEQAPAKLDVAGSITKAFTSVGEGMVGVVSSFDLLGIGIINEDQKTISEETGASTDVYKHIAANFTVFSAFAYLLFVLMYFPCLAVIGVAKQEMGGFYTMIMATYCTMLAWSVATLFYQIAEGHNILYILLACLILASVYGLLHLIGKKERINKVTTPPPPPMRKRCCGQ